MQPDLLRATGRASKHLKASQSSKHLACSLDHVKNYRWFQFSELSFHHHKDQGNRELPTGEKDPLQSDPFSSIDWCGMYCHIPTAAQHASPP